MKTLNSKETQKRVYFQENQLQLHVQKEPQNDPRVSKRSKKLKTKFFVKIWKIL